MNWHLSYRADPTARVLADGHYTRQKVGADQFVPPGRCVVLVIATYAYWVTSWPYAEYVKHAWPGAWVCSAFRSVRRCTVCDSQATSGRCDAHPDAETVAVARSSDLILDGLAATAWYWTPPQEGMITFVDPTKTHRKRDPGRCFRKAGFHVSGSRPGCTCATRPTVTDAGQVALHLGADQMPSARMPLGAQAGLFTGVA